jgi:hypothetical protein
MVTAPRTCQQIYCRRKEITSVLTLSGKHGRRDSEAPVLTKNRVKPEFANADYPEGQNIHVNWTGRGGNVSASTYTA